MSAIAISLYVLGVVGIWLVGWTFSDTDITLYVAAVVWPAVVIVAFVLAAIDVIDWQIKSRSKKGQP